MFGVKKVPCAWHSDEGRNDPNTSHGICDDCKEEQLSQRLQRRLGEFEQVPSYVEQSASDRRSRSLFQR